VHVHAQRHIGGPPSTSRSVLNFTGGEIIPIYLRLEQQLRQGQRGQRPHDDLLPELGGDRQCQLFYSARERSFLPTFFRGRIQISFILLF
jgi:hypothetical protein